MIHFDRVPQPDDFDTKAVAPGMKWLEKHQDARRPKDLWTPFRPVLATGFRDLCAYSAMYEAVGTVDHFISFDEDRSKAYDWSNYRFAAGWINSSKQNLPSSDVLDPFDVMDGWFEVILPSLQLVLTDRIPVEFKTRAETMLVRLHLRDDERVIRQRRTWYQMYQDGEIGIAVLRRMAPLIAAAVAKQEAVDACRPARI